MVPQSHAHAFKEIRGAKESQKHMAQLILTRNTQFHRALRIRGSFPLTLRVGRFFLLFSMTLMIGLLSFFYLIKFTAIHTQGSHLRKLELKSDDLKEEQDSKNLQIAEQKSLQSIKESSIAKGMIPAQNVSYIREDGTVAALSGRPERP